MKRKYSDTEILSWHKKYLKMQVSIPQFAAKENLSVYALRNGFARLRLKINSKTVTSRKFPIAED
jgi:hypothetical protein